MHLPEAPNEDAQPCGEERFHLKNGLGAHAVFSNCVVPIFGDKNRAAIQCGTGTLFRVADVSFLVTASHVTDIKTKHGIQLYICDGRPYAPGIPLEGTLHFESNLDVAVLELPEAIVQQLPNRTFLIVHHGDRANQRIGKGWYYIYGYPNCWSQPALEGETATAKTFTYGTVLYTGETDTFGDYNPEAHFLLELPKNGSIDKDGAPAELPKTLHGVSGASLWQAYYEGLPSVSWCVDDAMIVGVQTGTFKDGTVIKGTRWWAVNAIICKNYPKLEKPLSIITPCKRIISK
jgi:hypothetical protein